MAVKSMKQKVKSSSSYAGQSKVIATKPFPVVRGGKGHMFGKQSVKASKRG